MKSWFTVFAILCSAVVSASLSPAFGQDDSEDPAEPAEQQAEKSALDDGPAPPLPDVKMEPTDLGVRFTPGMARAMSHQFGKMMKRRYDLSDDQLKPIQDVMSRQMMKLAQDTQANGRDAIEFMMETMIANDGRFPPEEGKRFAGMIKPILPNLEKFFLDTGKQVAAEMTMTQRLKFTADSTAAMAGLTMFKSRMEKWERGEIGSSGNPFEDRREDEAASQPVDPNERPEVTRARRQVDRSMQWMTNQAENWWPHYVDQAIAYYKLDEAQANSARGVLKECQDRATAVRTPDWREKLKANRLQLQLSYEADPELNSGPWMFQIESEYERLMKPIDDLYVDLKKRIEAIPTTVQRATARETARQKFEKLGVMLPRA